MSQSDQLLKHFELARRDLLELTTANRLLSTQRNQAQGACIEIQDESAAEVFRMLVREGRVLRFEEGELIDEPDATLKTEKKRVTKKRAAKTAAASDEKPEPVGLMSSEKKSVSATDDVLHTILEPDDLDRRLQTLMTDTSTLMQEQGVNVLYLAIGFLRWFESGEAEHPHDAPLILIPVMLERGRAGHRYSLTWNDGEVETNLTLKVRLKNDFGIQLPDIPAVDEFSPVTYLQEIRQAISGQRGWEVRSDDMVLWAFSFSKLLMYRDLDPTHWPADRRLEDRPLIRALLQDGFPPVEPLSKGNDNIDSLFDPAQTVHVIDCDSSQSLVIEEAARGRSLVIQGPPGTGKSQTITNLIAAAVTSGKTILFVAEKMAALEVVKRRLDNIGIGDMCLELHSRMSNRKVVLQEIDRTLKLGTPAPPGELPETIRQLRSHQQTLNQFVQTMHLPFGKTGLTPYQILGELIELRAAATPLPDFQLPDSVEWTPEDYAEKFSAVSDLSRIILAVGDPDRHPWRGCRLENILPLDLERLLTTAPKCLAEFDEMNEAAAKLSQQLGDNLPTSLSDVSQLLRTLDALLRAPELDPQPLTGTLWSDHRQAIRELADHAGTILTAREKLSSRVTDVAWDLDVSADCQAYASYGQSWFRMLRSSYRRARQTLKSVLKGPQPATFEERREILQLLDRQRIASRKLTEASGFGEKVFGRLWLGLLTDWKRITAWEAWDAAAVQSGVSLRFRAMTALSMNELMNGRDGIRLTAAGVSKKLSMFLAGYLNLTETLKLNFEEAFGPSDARAPQSAAVPVLSEFETADIISVIGKLGPAAKASFADLRIRLAAWSSNPEGLQQWQTYRRSHAAVSEIGQGVLAERMTSGKLSATGSPAVFRFARSEAVLRAMLGSHPELQTFDGTKFESLIEDFCRLDIRRLELARTEVAAAHWQGIGRKRSGRMNDAVQLLKHELQKQRRHLPLRELLSRAGVAVQAVKPVFMMSPLSVAQYLDPGALEFDMLLIDEASQVRPVEALGAAARCRQIVVVGDDRQMPPTQFFGKVLGDIVNDENSPEMQAGDVESILGLAIARNMPQRMLRWHYRSKHESLIAVSNREFYDNQLYVVPSPERSGELGVKWHFVDGGQFNKGRNTVEAKVVAEAIMRHVSERPGWTLGVAAFSVSQRDAITEELEVLRRRNPELDSFFDPGKPDPFFIKNLENVQGDERDAIFVSVGYGPGEDGKVSLNFGPVSASGGERRLNVLMTRAKRVLGIFSSMHAEDIDLSRATGRGPAVFREYLKFAEKGGTAESSGTAKTSDRFVEVLSRQLSDRGYTVRAQVGIAGLYVDLAVIDPGNPGRFVLGIIVDGEAWRSARSARDRNRTTDGVLNGQGWILYHVWSLEWFNRPTEQLNRLIETIEAARHGRIAKKETRLASTVSEIHRQTGGPDPLSMAVSEIEAVPPQASRPDASANEGGLLAEIVSAGLKVGAAVLVAEKGKELDAAIDSLSEKKRKQQKKP